MMDRRQLIEYARKGIMAEIREHEKTVAKGRLHLKAIDTGVMPTTPRSRSEIEAIIAKAKAEIETLSQEERELRYELD